MPGLGPVGDRCDLDMADQGQERAQTIQNVAVQDLAMIDVELEPEVR